MNEIERPEEGRLLPGARRRGGVFRCTHSGKSKLRGLLSSNGHAFSRGWACFRVREWACFAVIVSVRNRFFVATLTRALCSLSSCPR